MTPTIDPAGGRDASSWDRAIAALPLALDWPPRGHWVVVAPHPDDEVLGLGGGLARSGRCGIPVDVVTVTDGEASHPGLDGTARRQLAARRRRESRAADHVLGVAPARTFLGLPDGRVVDHETRLVELLGPLLAGRSVVATVDDADGHPDHDATGRAVARVVEAVGGRLVRHAVWAWTWDDDTGGRLAGAARSVLDDDERIRKRKAVAAHASQVRPRGNRSPVLPGRALAHHLRGVEVVWGGRP